MKPRVITGGAIALAAALLLFAQAQSFAHEGHKGKPDEAFVLEQAAAAIDEKTTTASGADEQAAYDHARQDIPDSLDEESSETQRSNTPSPLAWLGKFHPPLTHFPIALLTAAALAELLLIRTGTQAYRHTVHFCVQIGGSTAIIAAACGWFFAGFRIVDEEWVMTAHRWAGTSVALFSGGLLYLLARMKSPMETVDRAPFRIALFSAAGLLGAAGFLGGALIYGLEHYAW